MNFKPSILSIKRGLAILLPSLLLLAGCGKNADIENYKANMTQFFKNVEIYHSSINAIDPNSETATSDLLTLLDSMNTTFSQMASLQVPEGFPGVEQLADEASTYMSDAVSCYHQAYDNEYDAVMEDVAYQYYKQANIRFQYIVSILHGDIPEEIFVYDEDTTSSETNENPDISTEPIPE